MSTELLYDIESANTRTHEQELADFVEAELPNMLYGIFIKDIETLQKWVQLLNGTSAFNGTIEYYQAKIKAGVAKQTYPAADIYDSVLQRYGAVQQKKTGWSLDSSKLDDLPTQHTIVQSVIVEELRNTPMLADSVSDLATGIHELIRSLKNRSSIQVQADLGMDNTLLNVAERLHIFSCEPGTNGTITVTRGTPDAAVVGSQLQLEFSIFLLQFFHHSIDDLSEVGWDSAIVPEKVVDELLEKSLLTKEMLLRTGLLKKDGDIFRANINKFRIEDESDLSQAIRELMANSIAIEELPPDITLVDPKTIKYILDKYHLTLQELIRSGHAIRAYSMTKTLRLNPQGRYYMIGQPEAIHTWKSSDEYATWLENETLKTVIVNRFIETLRQKGKLFDKASYVVDALHAEHPELTDTQIEAYLIPDDVITQDPANIFDNRDYSRLGYIAPAEKQLTGQSGKYRSRTMVLFPNPEHGLLFKNNLARKFENESQLFIFRVQQMMQSSDWNALPWRTDVPEEYGPIKSLTHEELNNLVAKYPPLTAKRLFQLGFTCYGQKSNPEPGTGIYLFSPERKAKSITESDWHKALLIQATQRGHDNLLPNQQKRST